MSVPIRAATRPMPDVYDPQWLAGRIRDAGPEAVSLLIAGLSSDADPTLCERVQGFSGDGHPIDSPSLTQAPSCVANHWPRQRPRRRPMRLTCRPWRTGSTTRGRAPRSSGRSAPGWRPGSICRCRRPRRRTPGLGRPSWPTRYGPTSRPSRRPFTRCGRTLVCSSRRPTCVA